MKDIYGIELTPEERMLRKYPERKYEQVEETVVKALKVERMIKGWDTPALLITGAANATECLEAAHAAGYVFTKLHQVEECHWYRKVPAKYQGWALFRNTDCKGDSHKGAFMARIVML